MRVKILKVFRSLEQRKFIFNSWLQSQVLKAGLSFLIKDTYFQPFKQQLREWQRILPSKNEFQQELEKALVIFRLQLDPLIHKTILECMTRLISIDDDEQDFKILIREVTRQYSLVEKILKDCTSVEF